MKKLLVAFILLFAIPVSAATYSLTPTDSYSKSGWQELSGMNSMGKDFATTESAYYSSIVYSNLSGPESTPLPGANYVLNVVARGEYNNSLLRVQLWSDSVYVTEINLGIEDIWGEWVIYTHTLDSTEIENIVDPWTMNVVIYAGNYFYEGPVDIDFIELRITEIK